MNDWQFIGGRNKRKERKAGTIEYSSTSRLSNEKNFDDLGCLGSEIGFYRYPNIEKATRAGLT
jgi:hypothetical protein